MMNPTDSEIELVRSTTWKMKFACGSVYSLVNELDGWPFRVFLKKGHTGMCQQALLEVVGRLLTIIFQSTDVPLERVWHTLLGTTCESGSSFVSGMSCLDGLARILRENYLVRPSALASPEEIESCAPTD